MAQNSKQSYLIKCFPSGVEAEFSIDDAFSRSVQRNLKQTHSAVGFQLTKDLLGETREGDFIWTAEKGLRTRVVVADCTAMLFYGQGSQGSFVGALHAGWRGSALGILENFWREVRPTDRLWVWLSPSICQQHFEVGGEVLAALGSRSSGFARPSGSPGKWLLDLKAFQISALKDLAQSNSVILNIFASSLCTYCQPEFISYRRARGLLASNERHIASIALR